MASRKSAHEKAVDGYIQSVVRGRRSAGRLERAAVDRYVRDRAAVRAKRRRDLSFDRAAAERAVEFFGLLRHSKGQWAGQPFHLAPWQAFLVWQLFGWKRADGTRRFRLGYFEVARKNGKALALDTRMPTPTGWTTMARVRVGDVLFDERGEPCAVTAATDVMEGRPCYRVVFSDDTSIVADAEHQWAVEERHRSGARILTTEELAGRVLCARRDGGIERRFSIPRPRSATRQIVSIEPVDSVPVRCIQVDSTSHLFLAGDGMIPTHNSTFSAGLGLYLGFFDGEPGAEVYCAATKRDQARIVHGEAVRMVRSSPGLGIKTFRDNLHVVETASKFEPLGADADTTDGLNIHGALVDEFHAHPTRDLFDRIETATGARRQPLIIVITTAGDDEQSPCFQEHERARAVLEGQLEDDSLLAFIAAPDEEDDWTDPRTWEKGNPNLGVSVRIDELAEQCAIAQQSPARENAFRRFRMNQWTRATTRFLSADAWFRCTGERPAPAMEDELDGDVCFAGLDLSSKSDMTALCMVFPPEDPDRGVYRAVWRFWLPEGALDRPGRPRSVPFEAWADQGFLKLTPGEALDHSAVFHELGELVPRFRIHEVMIDRWGAGYLRPQIEELGLVVAEFGQGYQSMSEPTKALEALVLSERLDHGGNPVASWHAECLEVRTDPAGNLKPSKPDVRKSSKRIDGMVALIMALGRAMLLGANPPVERSVYDERGLLTL